MKKRGLFLEERGRTDKVADFIPPLKTYFTGRSGRYGPLKSKRVIFLPQARNLNAINDQ